MGHGRGPQEKANQPDTTQTAAQEGLVSDEQLHQVEKEVAKLAQQVDELTNELIDTQEAINLKRLQDIEHEGERLSLQDTESVIPPEDLVDEHEDNNLNHSADES